MLSDEGLRLFFPLAALHAAFWPLLWIGAWRLELPLTRTLSPVVWHAAEMILGAWGAALIGFLTTAIPEWTNTPRLRGRLLWALAGLWAAARLVGLAGADVLVVPAALADMAWLALLLAYLLQVSIGQRDTTLLAIAGWLAGLSAATLLARLAMIAGDSAGALHWLRIAGLVYLGLLGLVLARVSIPVSNLVLDPSEQTSPFRPHPGRINLAPGLVAVALLGELAGASAAVGGFLWIAAGAAFMDRVAEGFIGRTAARTEILALMGAAAFAGIGLLLLGAARLGAPWGDAGPLHLALMGGLGIGVLAVLAIAGRLHTGRPLGLARPTRVAFVLITVAVLLRTLPPMGLAPWPPGPMHLLSALAWCGAFLLWLADYWPLLSRPSIQAGESSNCG
ncbi:MAG: NnrS family protein [Lautropia sp.]